MIYEDAVASPTRCSLTCHSCPRVLCVTSFRTASSYRSLLELHRVCLDCYSEALC